MSVETLTYDQIAERMTVSREAARAIVKRHRLPRSRSNDGKTLVNIDLAEIRHKPLPARSLRGHQPVSDAVTGLMAQIKTLEAELAAKDAELAAEQQCSEGHRADFERERTRSDQLMSCLLAQTIDLMTACEVTARLEGELATLRLPPKRRRWWQRRAG
jgi:hypothetical protein